MHSGRYMTRDACKVGSTYPRIYVNGILARLKVLDLQHVISKTHDKICLQDWKYQSMRVCSGRPMTRLTCKVGWAEWQDLRGSSHMRIPRPPTQQNIFRRAVLPVHQEPACGSIWPALEDFQKHLKSPYIPPPTSSVKIWNPSWKICAYSTPGTNVNLELD